MEELKEKIRKIFMGRYRKEYLPGYWKFQITERKAFKMRSLLYKMKIYPKSSNWVWAGEFPGGTLWWRRKGPEKTGRPLLKNITINDPQATQKWLEKIESLWSSLQEEWKAREEAFRQKMAEEAAKRVEEKRREEEAKMLAFFSSQWGFSSLEEVPIKVKRLYFLGAPRSVLEEALKEAEEA